MIACYERVSTELQAEKGYSIEEQISRLNSYCDAMGWKSVKHYTDPGYSGASLDRPAMQKLIEDVQAGKIERVVVYKLDRLSRSQKDTLHIIEDVLLNNKADFVSVTENLDTSTPFGKAMIGILSVFAQLEREQIKERMMMGRVARAKQGKFHGSMMIPIGYDYDNGNLVINDFEASQVRRVFDLFVSGYTPNGVTTEMNKAGLSHKYGPWAETSVRYVLQNKTYTGQVSFGGTWYPGTHEAIIDQETFDKAQQKLNEAFYRHVVLNTRPGKATSYLGGFLRCKQCGAKYTKVTHSRSKYSYPKYGCMNRTGKGHKKTCECSNKYWHMNELDDIVFNEIKKLALEPVQKNAPRSKRIDFDVEIDKIDAQIGRLIDLYAVQGIPVESVQEKIENLSDRKKQLVKAKKTQEQDISRDRAEAIEAARAFQTVLDGGNFDEIRSVLFSLIDHIDLDGDDVEIHWTFK